MQTIVLEIPVVVNPELCIQIGPIVSEKYIDDTALAKKFAKFLYQNASHLFYDEMLEEMKKLNNEVV